VEFWSLAFSAATQNMGRVRRKRTHHAKRDVHRASRTRAWVKDLDQIQLHDLLPHIRTTLENQELDVNKPGLAQHYCVECARYFESDVALRAHWKTKLHKRRCKKLAEPAYTIEEAERAAGLGRDNVQRTPKASIAPAPSFSTVAAVTMDSI